MPKLTDAKRAFVNKFVVNKAARQDARVASQRQDYDRRRLKVEEEIKALPAGHPALAGLSARLQAAAGKAQGGGNGQPPALDAAYDDLAAVKRDARAAAKGYKKSLSPAATSRELDALAAGIVPIEAIAVQNANTMKTLLAEVRATPVPPIGGYDDVVAFQASISGQEARWRADAEACRVRAERAGAMATKLDAPTRLAAARHELAQLKATPDKQLAPLLPALEARLAGVANAIGTGAAVRTAASLARDIATANKELETAITILRTVQVRDAGPGLDDRFADVEARERAIVDEARNAYLQAQARDSFVLDPKRAAPDKPMGPPPMVRFATEDMLDAETTGLVEAAIDQAAIDRAVAKAATKTTAFIAGEAARTPDSDKLFDLALRSLNDLRGDMGKALGLPGEPEDWPPRSRLLAEGLADAVKAAVLANSPNRPSTRTQRLSFDEKEYDVAESMTLNGADYINPKIIGIGGLGLITLYEGQDAQGQPTTVVVKSTLAGSGDAFIPADADPYEDPAAEAATKRAEMVEEMRIHRALMGGEGGTANPNVVAMKGAAVGADGSLHMVMEYAEAGNAQEFTQAVGAATRAGILPKAAQQALQQDTMLQAARGLKAMHDLGVLHNDLKAVNYLVAADGTVKVSDFGSGEAMSHGFVPGNVAPVPNTTYAAGEYQTARTDMSDVYALGVMLHGNDAEIGIEGKGAEVGYFKSNIGPAGRSGHGVTSLDRLRNAMLADKPEDRPTLEGILMSSYLNDAREAYGDPEGSAAAKPPLKELRQAAAAYAKAVGREVGKLDIAIGRLKGKHAATAKVTTDPARLASLAAQLEADLAPLQAQIDAINERPAVAPLLAELKRIGAAFGTAKGNEADNAWDFAYRKTELGLDRVTRGSPSGLPDDLAKEVQGRETVN